MTDNCNIEQKQIYLRAYQDLSQLENDLKHLEEKTSHFQVSVLGSVAQFYGDKNIEISKDTNMIKAYWEDLLGERVNFGSFYNPESGSVFIAGALVTTFLHKINGKCLATLSSGPYGIFRGMGGSEAQATTYLKQLNSGQYLLILRGFEDKTQELDELLNNPIEYAKFK
ncbi:hypothetical protein [Gelidibacter salicanalis]|uniref:Uncharacterized protein n=1 Tax=Gelidibacter salicanalis TaxID=291193 RepID=A0A934NBZ3_9FLAO|nr:hypothetical protein [Gelidibacter salicanalis]MBJ7880170.1 hypothetical protein [Gelidibacter salicanalis]